MVAPFRSPLQFRHQVQGIAQASGEIRKAIDSSSGPVWRFFHVTERVTEVFPGAQFDFPIDVVLDVRRAVNVFLAVTSEFSSHLPIEGLSEVHKWLQQIAKLHPKSYAPTAIFER